ncbi:hypothetical protein [Flavitalea flava]
MCRAIINRIQIDLGRNDIAEITESSSIFECVGFQSETERFLDFYQDI